MATQLSFQSYLDVISSGIINPLCRLEFLRNEDESVQTSIIKLPLDSSSLTCDITNGVRRSLSLILDNSNKDFLPSLDSLWIGFKFQLYLGYKDGQDREIWFPQGLFCVFNSDPSISSSLSDKKVTLNCQDKWSLLSIPIGHIYIIPSGSSVLSAIRSILKLVGDKKAPILQDLSDIPPFDLRWGESSTYGDVLKGLANLYSRECYYDTTGHFVFQEFMDASVVETIYTFSTDQVAYMGSNRILKYSQTFNHIYVIGASMNSGIAYTGEYINNDLTSNTRVQLIGDKPMPVITDSKISSNELCNQRAKMEGMKAKRVQENISINSISLLHLDVNKAITISDDSIGCYAKKYVIQQFQLSLDAKSPMTITGFLFSDSSDFEDRLTMTTI